jgi:choline dehydrogenase-like flavoprotein
VQPDMQLHFGIAVIDDHGCKFHWGAGFSCHVALLQPKSRGSVRLTDVNPMAAPAIDPNFLGEPEKWRAWSRASGSPGGFVTPFVLAVPLAARYPRQCRKSATTDTGSRLRSFLGGQTPRRFTEPDTTRLGSPQRHAIAVLF